MSSPAVETSQASRSTPVRPFHAGDVVRAEPRHRGSWRRYSGRVGSVVARAHEGEIAVDFGSGSPSYFHADELVLIQSVADISKKARKQYKETP